MKILTYPLGDLATNSYILINETTRDAIAIDVGANGNFLLLEGLKICSEPSNSDLIYPYFIVQSLF